MSHAESATHGQTSTHRVVAREHHHEPPLPHDQTSIHETSTKYASRNHMKLAGDGGLK
jgi:hypothetical protein